MNPNMSCMKTEKNVAQSGTCFPEKLDHRTAETGRMMTEYAAGYLYLNISVNRAYQKCCADLRQQRKRWRLGPSPQPAAFSIGYATVRYPLRQMHAPPVLLIDLNVPLIP